MIKYEQKLLYLIMLIIVFCTDSFIVFANVNTDIKKVFQTLLVVVAIYIAFRTQRYSKRILIYWLIMASCVLGTSIYNNDFVNGNYIKIILLFIGALVANSISFECFRDNYIKVITLICGFSLITFFISLLFDCSTIFPMIENTKHTQMVFMGLSNVNVSANEPRNYGPFWEPGVFSIYLTFAILFLLIKEKKITKQVIFLIIGVVTTFSTAGYVTLIVLISYYLVGNSYGKKEKRKKYCFFICFLSIMGIMVTQIDMLNAIVLSKLSDDSASYASTAARIYSIYGNIAMWMDSPIFGVGPTRLNDFYEQYLYNQGYAANSNTNGLLIMFSMYGTFLGLLTLYGLIKFASMMDQSIIGKIMIFSVLMIMLFAEPLQTSCLFNILIFYGWTRELRKERDINYA